MKLIFFILVSCIISVNVYSFTPEIINIKLSDGEKIKGRLCLPDNKVKTIVFYIHGTGPNTYLAKRATFNYYDELANKFCEQDAAFFTYNRRGCDIGETPPLFVDVDSVKYAKYTPLQEVDDVEVMIKSLQKDKRFKDCKMVLYGASEGTMIAPVVAERNKVRIDALLLHGYVHDNLFDVIKWQNEGNGIMIMANAVFDQNDDMRISKIEYEDSTGQKSAQREYYFKSQPFESVDVVKDDFIDVEDIKKLRTPYHDYLMKCIAENNYQWIKNYYYNITPQWFKAHFELEPNKTRLLKINIPVYIFHGTDDANVPVSSIYDLQSRFNACNKTNLTIYVFEKHSHDLNFTDWLQNKKWSEGFETIFKVVKDISYESQ